MSKNSFNLSGSKTGMGCAVLFLLPFVLVGVFMTGKVATELWGWRSAQSWVERPCWIDRAELKEQSDDGTTYQAVADYRYEFDNRPFNGSRVWLGSGFDNVGNFHRRVHRELQKHQTQGRPFRCFVNPSDPSVSVLYRDLRGEMLLFELAFVLTFGGVGVGGLVGLAFVSRKTKRMNSAREINPSEPWTWDAATADGRLLPKPNWIAIAAFTFIWNSISWPIASLFLWNEFQGGPSIIWFLLLFPLVGLGMLWLTFRALRIRIRFGLPVLTIQPWPFYVGDELSGTIEFPHAVPASAELVIELRVFVKGSGDDSDKEFFKEVTRIPNEGDRCSFQFTPPADLPRTELLNENTNDSTANWEIKVTGSKGASEFEAAYELAAFARNQSPATP